MLIKDVRNSLKNFKPDDEIWIHFITKDDIQERFSSCEYTDENDNLIDTDPLVTDDVFHDITRALDDDNYLWERFSETFDDICRDKLENLLKTNDEPDDVDDESLWQE